MPLGIASSRCDSDPRMDRSSTDNMSEGGTHVEEMEEEEDVEHGNQV